MKRLSLVAALLLFSACSSQPGSTPATAQAPAAPAKIPVTTKSPEARAHYDKALYLFENARLGEGMQELNQALAIDPEFPTAKALHSIGTQGPDGLKELEQALAASASLPEAERLLIESSVALRRGDQEKAASALRRVTELAPGDYLGFLQLGAELLNEQKYAEAQQALKKATELNPSNGGAQNQLGYAALRQGDTATAISAFEQYARIQPQEPNAQDSLGEALLAAGRFKDAEAAFQKAVALAPQFWAAHQGIAYAKFYAGDWAAGRAAAQKARDTAQRAVDKLTADADVAASFAAQRDFPQTMKALAAMEHAPGLTPEDVAFVPVLRGLTQFDAGRSREALAAVAPAIAAADGGKYPAGLASAVRREALRVRITAEAQLGDAAAAQKSADGLDAEAKAQPASAQAQTAMHYGHGMLALAKKDSAAALAAFDQCSREDMVCAWQKAVAADKAGDKAAAAAARDVALKIYRRDTAGLVVRSRVGAPAGS